MIRFPTGLARASFVLALASLGACRSTDPLEEFWGENGYGLTQEQLRTRLVEFNQSFSTVLERASYRITRESQDLGLRRTTIEWRERMVPAIRRASLLPSPVEGYLDCWTLCVQQRRFFQNPQRKPSFGDYQQVAIDASLALEEEIEAIGRAFMDEANFAKARDDVHQFADTHAVSSEFARQGSLPSSAQDDEELNWILAVPLKAVNPFGGINAGAKAIREFTQVADEFKSVVSYMPEELSWRLELLLCDIEERRTLVSLEQSMDEISDGVLVLAEVARTLPEETRRTMTHAFDEIEGSEGTLRAVLEETRATLVEMTHTLERAESLTTSLDRTLAGVVQAGEAWQGVGLAFGLDGADEEEPAREDEPSFFADVSASAENVTASALELRGLVADLRALADSPESEALAHRTNELGRSTIDHAAWRLGQLVVVGLLAGFFYRLATARLRPR